MDDKILNLINGMTLKEKIGQLILGQAEGTEVTEEFETFIKEYPLCGYRVNGQNIRNKGQVTKFISQIKMTYKNIGLGIEPLLGCDEEGGTLSVFQGLVTEFPGNMALGASDDCYLAELQGNILSKELSEVGINMIFAPVADINLQQNNPVIGVRSFGDNPEKVTELCRAYTVGLNSGGTAACAKHFPGHGNTTVDSHYSLPSNLTDNKTLRETELIPFAALAANKVDCIMVSHVTYPNITGDNLPASLSSKLINNLLRRELGYDGVILTDDLEMQAILKNYDIEDAAKKFICAGGDIVLINGTRTAAIKAYNALIQSVEEGIINEDRIDASLIRILRLKEKIRGYYKDKSVKFQDPQLTAKTICKKSITLIKDKNKILPLEKGNRVLLILPTLINLTEADTSAGKVIEISKFLIPHASEVKTYNIDLQAPYNSFSEININHFDVVIQCTINSLKFPYQLEILRRLNSIKPTIALLLRDPYEAVLIPEDTTVIATYSSCEKSMKVTADLIYGEGDFLGKLPVKIRNLSIEREV